MKEILIENADKADLEAILVLQKKAYLSEAELYQDYSLPPLTQTLMGMEEDFSNQLILKATSGGRLAGSVRAYEKEGVCHIGRLVVDPSHQNKGLGKRLLQSIEARFPEATRFELFTGDRSTKSLHIYHQAGYQVYRKQKISDTLTLVFLRKE